MAAGLCTTSHLQAIRKLRRTTRPTSMQPTSNREPMDRRSSTQSLKLWLQSNGAVTRPCSEYETVSVVCWIHATFVSSVAFRPAAPNAAENPPPLPVAPGPQAAPPMVPAVAANVAAAANALEIRNIAPPGTGQVNAPGGVANMPGAVANMPGAVADAGALNAPRVGNAPIVVAGSPGATPSAKSKSYMICSEALARAKATTKKTPASTKKLDAFEDGLLAFYRSDISLCFSISIHG